MNNFEALTQFLSSDPFAGLEDRLAATRRQAARVSASQLEQLAAEILSGLGVAPPAQRDPVVPAPVRARASRAQVAPRAPGAAQAAEAADLFTRADIALIERDRRVFTLLGQLSKLAGSLGRPGRERLDHLWGIAKLRFPRENPGAPKVVLPREADGGLLGRAAMALAFEKAEGEARKGRGKGPKPSGKTLSRAAKREKGRNRAEARGR